MFRYCGPVQEGQKEKMVVFASDVGVDALAKASLMACDGTFQECFSFKKIIYLQKLLFKLVVNFWTQKSNYST